MAIITILSGLSSQANGIIFVLLVVAVVAIIAGSATYFGLKGKNLYKEHQETEALARKVLFTEARRIEEAEESSFTKDFSLVPTLPPVYVPHRYPYSSPAIAPSFSYGHTQVIASRSGLGISPFHANASIMIQCTAPDRPALPWISSGNTPPRQAQPEGTRNTVSKARKSKSVDRRTREADKRKILGPLSVGELESRRSNNGKGKRRNGPRIAGKENVCGGVGSRTSSVDGSVMAHHRR